MKPFNSALEGMREDGTLKAIDYKRFSGSSDEAKQNQMYVYNICCITSVSPTIEPSSVATMHFSTSPDCIILVIIGEIDL
jgi:hypothetical protein